MSTLASYYGRTVDALAFQGVRPAGDALLAQDLIGGGGAVCTGIQKLAQRFVLELLTEQGSMPYLPERGTAFMTQLRQGAVRTDADVSIAFAFAAAIIAVNLAAEDGPGDPPDERYASATLAGVTVTPGYAWLRIELASQAGTSRRVVLPVQTL